jgi:hypothetical protein
MEILDRLERLKEEHRDAKGELSYESHTCLQARAIIQGLTNRVAELEKAENAGQRMEENFAGLREVLKAINVNMELMVNVLKDIVDASTSTRGDKHETPLQGDTGRDAEGGR